MEYSKEILDTFEYNGITLEHYRLVEPIGNTEIIGKWEKGKEKEWEVGYYEDLELEDDEEDNTPTNNSKSPLVDTDDPLPF